jgi:hypothetical protein
MGGVMMIKKINLSIALTLTSIFMNSLVVAETCEQARQSIDQCDNKSKYVSARIACYNDVKTRVKQVCITDLQDQYDDDLSDLLDTIKSKYDGVSKEEKERLSEIIRNLTELNEINIQYKAEFEKRGMEIATFSKEIKNVFIPSFDIFHEQLMVYIQQGNDSDEADAVQEAMHSINSHVFNENRLIYEKINQLSSIQFTNEYLYDRYQSQIGRFSGFIEEFELGQYLLTVEEPEVLEKLKKYLSGRYDEVNNKTTTMIESFDAKLMALINRDVRLVLDESIQTNILLTRKASFLDEINVVVQDFQLVEASDFNNLPFQIPAWESALALEQLVVFCESSSAEYWHSLGCNRALSFKSAVNTKKTSSIPNAMRFALFQIGLVDDSPMPDVQEYITELINEGKIETAAYLFDNLLKQMEVQQ